jgi:hypothetical protein
MAAPLEIRYLSLNLTPEVGANDSLVATRVVPAGRVGNKLFARTLLPGEADPGIAVAIDPSIGEELHFPPGSVRISIHDVDRVAKAGPDGFAAVTNTVWTWLFTATPTDPTLFRFLLAAARRLDTAHFLHTKTDEAFGGIAGPFHRQRDGAFAALGVAEMVCIALSRAADMLVQITDRFGLAVVLPPIITAHAPALREIRNAFEHIEDRAFGNVHGKPHADALSIFHQPDFLEHRVLSYGSHRIDTRSDFPAIFLAARQFIFDAAVGAAGPAKVLNEAIAYFQATPTDNSATAG